MNKVKSLLLVIALLISMSTKAQYVVESTNDSTTLIISLSQAQEYALKNSYAIKNSLLDLEIAKKKIGEPTALGLPQVSANIKYQHMFDIPTTLMPDFISPLMLGTFLQQPQIFSAGTLDKAYISKTLDSISKNPSVFPAQFGQSESGSFGFTISQLIFSGEYIVGLQASKIFKEFSEQAVTKSEKDTKESVSKSYYLALVARENKNILDSTFNNMDKIALEMEAMNKQGFIDATDVDQIKLTLSTLRDTRNFVSRQAELAERLLKFQLGVDLSRPIVLTDTLKNIINSTNVASLTMPNYELNNNIDYKLMQTQEGLAVLNLKREQSKFLPSVAGFFSYSKNAASNNFSFFESSQKWYPTSIAGLQIDIPIFSSGMRHFRVQQARLSLDKVQVAKQQVKEGLLLDFQQSDITFKSAQEKYLTQKSNLELAKKIYDRTFVKYKQGVSSSLELTQAQNQYLNMQSSYFTAVVEMLNAKAKLDKIIN